MLLEFDDATHTYYADGVKVPSVTQVLSPLYSDVAAVANPILRDMAAKRGSRVHEATMLWDYTGDITDDLLDAETAPYITAYIDWERDYRPRMLRIEYPLTNGHYAGTIDRLAEVDGVPCVIDIKTGQPDVRAVSAQCYAYRELLRESGTPAEKLYVLQLKKEGRYGFRELDLGRGERFWKLCWELNKAIREDKEGRK